MQPEDKRLTRPSGVPHEEVQPISSAGKISHEVYNAVIDQITPLDVRLIDTSFTLRTPVHSGPLSAQAHLESPELLDKTSGPSGEIYVQIGHAARFAIVASDETVAAEGLARFTVRLRVGFEPPEEFWRLFLIRNVKLYTYPALRDLVASLSARASLVVLPLASVAVIPRVHPPSLPSPKME